MAGGGANNEFCYEFTNLQIWIFVCRDVATQRLYDRPHSYIRKFVIDSLFVPLQKIQ